MLRAEWPVMQLGPLVESGSAGIAGATSPLVFTVGGVSFVPVSCLFWLQVSWVLRRCCRVWAPGRLRAGPWPAPGTVSVLIRLWGVVFTFAGLRGGPGHAAPPLGLLCLAVALERAPCPSQIWICGRNPSGGSSLPWGQGTFPSLAVCARPCSQRSRGPWRALCHWIQASA